MKNRSPVPTVSSRDVPVSRADSQVLPGRFPSQLLPLSPLPPPLCHGPRGTPVPQSPLLFSDFTVPSSSSDYPTLSISPSLRTSRKWEITPHRKPGATSVIWQNWTLDSNLVKTMSSLPSLSVSFWKYFHTPAPFPECLFLKNIFIHKHLLKLPPWSLAQVAISQKDPWPTW